MSLIFQYGSNTDASRLRERLGDIDDLGRAQTVDEYELAFNKWSTNGKCAAADLVKPRKGGRRIWGVVYKLTRPAFKKLKEEIEGRSYRPQRISVVDARGATRRVTTFRVKRNRRRPGLHTTGEYVGHIVSGLRDHGVEEEDPDYIQRVINIAIQTNDQAKDQEAGSTQNTLIERLRQP